MTESIYRNARVERHFERDPNGKIGGVAAGLAHRLDLSVFWLRLLWFLSIPISAGFSIGLYLMLWISLPKARINNDASRRVILGVCERISLRYNLDLGMIRFIALLSLLVSAFSSSILYFLLHWAMPIRETPKLVGR